MPAQVQGDDAVFQRKLLQLVMPLFSLSPKPVDKNKRPLGMIGRDVNRRKPQQAVRGPADLPKRALHDGKGRGRCP